MPFSKFHSFYNLTENLLNTRWMHQHELIKCTPMIAMEKIHGSNFQIIFDGDSLNFGSRNQLLGNPFSFYGFNDVINTKYIDIIEGFTKYSKDKKINCNLYGEIFGPGVMKEIFYGNEQQFKIFDLIIDGNYVTFKELEDILNDLNIIHHLVPVYNKNLMFDEWFNFNPNIPSLLSPTHDICEGVVIKPYDINICNHHSDKLEYFIWKIKNIKFKERKTKIEKTKIDENITPEISNLIDEYETYFTPQRLDNVTSKLGSLDITRMGEFIKALVEDARKDFEFDNLPINFNDKKFKILFSKSANFAKKIIIERLKF